MREVPVARDPLKQSIAEHTRTSVSVYPRSFQETEVATCGLVRTGTTKKVVVLGELPAPFETETTLEHAARPLHLCPTNPTNAAEIRRLFPWAGPVPLGTTTALGCGDRLGLASPGHIRACREADVVPVLAQQSIREMERTGRTPQEVLDDATWAVFQEGYTRGFGADADHLKTPKDMDACFAAGYTMYTVDPSDHVNNDADHLEGTALNDQFQALPWDRLGTTTSACLDRYAGRTVARSEASGSVQIELDEEDVQRAAVKYGAALAHTRDMAEHLAARYQQDRSDAAYDLEMSVDETDHPTRPHEHYFVAAELDRLGVDVTSLAPRFTGDFEKGIDFVGDLEVFENSFRQHATIAKSFGSYKLSIHSGSDKFSAFPILGRYAGDHLHLKTAGTSFLEALRIPARHAPGVFREIVDYAFERFEEDRKTYHVTTDLNVIPDPEGVPDEALEETYLDDDNGRQLLHITYGSILTAETDDGTPRFRDRFYDVLDEHEEEHYETLKSHFLDHIESVGAMLVPGGTPDADAS